MPNIVFMRAHKSASVLSASIAVACAAALALPFAAPAGAASPARHAGTPDTAVPGSTRSLRLTPLASDRSAGATAGAELSEQHVKPFSLLGVVWNDRHAELDGTVQVRTRHVGSTAWSGWQDVETHNDDHAADTGTAEADAPGVHGSTAPLWVGNSDGVQVRVRPAAPAAPARTGVRGASVRPTAAPLPAGLRLDLVDPGPDPGPQQSADDRTTSGADEGNGPAADTGQEGDTGVAAGSGDTPALAPEGPTELPALSKADTEAELAASTGRRADTFVGPRPRIVTRSGWGADESIRESQFLYTNTVKAAFVHHTATGNNYTCAQAPSLMRSIYRYHVKSNGWRDIGYNFVIDKCGNIYEGRAGGVTKAVMGAHTLGFNTDTTGIAVLGTFTSADPPEAVVSALAHLSAWKLGLTGADPSGRTTLVSGGGNRYPKGTDVKLDVISGHRDGFATDCPGERLYQELPAIRDAAADLQGR